jgi:hypothetical protein
MADLAGRGPIGQKAPKPQKQRRKPISKRSKKKLAYLASQERQEGLAHMAAVAQLPCIVCGAWPVEVHHMPNPRSDMRVVALCPPHHRREFGPGAYHFAPPAFRDLHGSDEFLLNAVKISLAGAQYIR